MIRRLLPLCSMLLVLLMAYACIEVYDPPIRNSDIDFLVVDGFLDASSQTAAIRLTRTQEVKSNEPIPVETGAVVSVEDSQGRTYPLSEANPGVYNGPVPVVPGTDETYRLLIHTAGNRDYASDFVPILETPPLDSVTWSVKNNGVEIAVNTHDPTGATRHYRWNYQETYQYHANFNSLFLFEGDEIVLRPYDQSIFTCWKTQMSADININSTKDLESSVVSRFPLLYISQGSIKISFKYSVLVQQHALTEDAYAYWLSLQRSTENLGGLFDPLPSEVVGNIKSLSNPSETVIGYFGGGTIQESRLFVARGELPKEVTGSSNFNPHCYVDTVYLDELDEIHRESSLLVDAVYSPFGSLIGYTTTITPCADCRTLEGTTQRPEFWE